MALGRDRPVGVRIWRVEYEDGFIDLRGDRTALLLG